MLLLDEPLSALDAKVRLQLREQIRTLQQRLGTTTLFVTHDQEEALSMADRVGVMRDGKLEQVADPSELYSRPATAFVAEFVGTMNRLPGELAGAGTVTVLGASCAVIQGGGPRPARSTCWSARKPDRRARLRRQRHRQRPHLPRRDHPRRGPAVGGHGGPGRLGVGRRPRDAPGHLGPGRVAPHPGARRAAASSDTGDTGFPGGLAAAQLPVPGLPGPGDRSAAAEDNQISRTASSRLSPRSMTPRSW